MYCLKENVTPSLNIIIPDLLGMFGHKDRKDYILCAIRICSSFSITDISGGISSKSSFYGLWRGKLAKSNKNGCKKSPGLSRLSITKFLRCTVYHQMTFL